MLKLFLFYISINLISSEKILAISVQEKKLLNIDEGGILPLKVKTSFDVEEDIIFSCNSNIRYNFDYTTFGYDVYDEDPLPKIPAGTKAGSEIKFNCLVFEPVYNENVTLAIFDEHFITAIYVNGSWKAMNEAYDDIIWVADENNDKIEIFYKFIFSFSTSKNLGKNDKIYLDMDLMVEITEEINIIDETFILNEKNQIKNISLISCSKI